MAAIHGTTKRGEEGVCGRGKGGRWMVGELWEAGVEGDLEEREVVCGRRCES